MTERMFLILSYLMTGGEDDSPIKSKVDAVSINTIVDESGEPLLYSPSTVYKSIVELQNLGFVNTGIMIGKKHTYYITAKGIEYIEKLLEEA